MSPELQTTLLWVVILTAIMVCASALSGAVMVAVPSLFGGVVAMVGACIGNLFGHSIVGAVIGGVVGFVGLIVLFLVQEEKKYEAARIERDAQHR